jgi:hypothetical protein
MTTNIRRVVGRSFDRVVHTLFIITENPPIASRMVDLSSSASIIDRSSPARLVRAQYRSGARQAGRI